MAFRLLSLASIPAQGLLQRDLRLFKIGLRITEELLRRAIEPVAKIVNHIDKDPAPVPVR